MPEARIEFIIDTFVKALDWDKPVIEEEPEIEELKSEEENDDDNDFEQEDISTSEYDYDSTEYESEPSTQPQYQPPVSPPPEPPQNIPQNTPTQTLPAAPTAGNNSKILIGIIVILLIALFFNMSDKPSNQTTTSSQSSTVQQAPQPQTQSQNMPEPERETYRDARSELSLNGIDIGVSVDQMINVFGRPNEIEDRSDGGKTYNYDKVKIGIVEGKVSSFVNRDPKYKTFRGLHVGSTYSEVVDKYGYDSSDMEYDNMILHEYKFRSIDGQDGLLRFAVNQSDNRVNYISIRIPEKETPKQETKPETKKNNDIPENVMQAAKAFVEYHKNITDGNYSQAYNSMTSSRQNSMGTLQQYRSGFSDTISSEVTDLNLISNNGDSVTLEYVLDAKDRTSNGRVLYQQFKGQVEMVKVGNTWKINSGKSQKIGERIN